MQELISVPFVPELESNFDAFPAQPAVFALHLKNAQGLATPPYLGRTQDLRRRLSRLLRPSGTLTKLLNLRELTTEISYQIVGSQLEALWWLYRLNRAHYPRNYRHRMRLRSPVLLKINLSNRFPRCYPARRIAADGSLYYGPFLSRPAAERFASTFLDLFKIRRCVEDLEPNPSHPGCIYSQIHMCLAPCFAGCTDEQYQQEVENVVSSLDAEGGPKGLISSLEAARTNASELQEFEEAARLHRRVEKLQEVSRLWPDIVRKVTELNAIVIERGAAPKSVVFFRIHAGEIRGPVSLSLDENVAAPAPLDLQLHALLDPLAAHALPEAPVGAQHAAPLRGVQKASPAPAMPLWEHLSLLTRWYYSSFRTGEILMLGPKAEIPHKRLIRLCRKLVS